MSSQTRPCEICGLPIDADRIDVVPETRLCVEHAKLARKYGGEFIVTGTQASLGKGGSLKKNYGDITVEKRRNIDGMGRMKEDYERQASDGNHSPNDR
jgi:hypothetical protein